MLSVEKDFFWTCTAMNHPLYAFKFTSSDMIGELPKVTISIMVNIEKRDYYGNGKTIKGAKIPEYPDLGEFATFAVKLVKQVL